MATDTTIETMAEVHEILSTEFGRLAPELTQDGTQLVHLPGGAYAVVVHRSTEETITIHKGIGCPQWDRPGLADFLLREHSRWLLARLERNEDMLAVEYTVLIDGLTPAVLRRAVTTVHQAAIGTERLLVSVGALELGEED